MNWSPEGEVQVICKDLVGKGLGTVRARIACGPANTVDARLATVRPTITTVRARLAWGQRGIRFGGLDADRLFPDGKSYRSVCPN